MKFIIMYVKCLKKENLMFIKALALNFKFIFSSLFLLIIFHIKISLYTLMLDFSSSIKLKTYI